jgi:hypothetical protein
MQVFEIFLGLSSFDYSKALLVCRHISFPISSGGMNFISIETIALVTYLESCQTLITFVITFRFLLDLRPFLLKVIGANSSGSFPFQVHLRLFWELPPPSCNNMFTPFKHLTKREVNWFQKIIWERLFDMSFDSHQTHLRSHANWVWELGCLLALSSLVFICSQMFSPLRSKLN